MALHNAVLDILRKLSLSSIDLVSLSCPSLASVIFGILDAESQANQKGLAPAPHSFPQLSGSQLTSDSTAYALQSTSRQLTVFALIPP